MATEPTAVDEQRRYVVFRMTASVDGSASCYYVVPGEGNLAPDKYDDWLTQIGDSAELAVLAIREYRGPGGALRAGLLERRLGSADGKYCGNPCRLEIVGRPRQVRAWRTTDAGDLEEMQVPPVATISRDTLLVGEEQTIHAAYGGHARILAMRGPTAVEELMGLSAIVRIRPADGRSRLCGVGWHGTLPFLIEGKLLSPEPPPADPGVARPVGHGSSLVSPDQAKWLRYAECYEDRVILETRIDEATGEMFALAGNTSGQILWHRIDRNGVERERQPPTDRAANGT